MNRTRQRIATLLLVSTLAVVGCASSAPNQDGWWDEDVHEVDGFWVTEETLCEPPVFEPCDLIHVTRATEILLEREPEAAIVGTSVAALPRSRGRDPSDVTITTGGLMQPVMILFDLADGARRAVGMTCGPDSRDPRRTTCEPDGMTAWRVGF